MKRLAKENIYAKALDLIQSNPDKLEDFLEETFINTYGDNYQTDVYLYVNDNDYEVDTFTNVGGNSWLNDDHIRIYTFNERGIGWNIEYEEFDTDEEYVNYLIDVYDVDVDLNQFGDEYGDIDWSDAKDYINENYPDAVSLCMEDLLQEAWSEYVENQILEEIYTFLGHNATYEEE